MGVVARRLALGMRQRGARLMPREFARGESETGNRAAEAHLAEFLEAEAGLHRQAAQACANRLALDPQSPRRQMRVAHRARALELDRADDRAVSIDPALAARAFDAGVVEHLADDEAARFLGSHLAGERRDGGHEAECERYATQHHEHSETNATGTDCGSTLSLADYAGGSSPNPEHVYPILTTIRPLTCPFRMSAAALGTSERPISVVIAASFWRSRSVSSLFLAVFRLSSGHMTVSMP